MGRAPEAVPVKVARTPRRRRGKTSPAVPSTFGGVASVALRPFGCLLFWQIVVATAAAFVVAWSFGMTWARALERAAQALQHEGSIAEGRLHWPRDQAVVLHEDGFLSLVIDPEGRRGAGLSADVGLCLESSGLAVRSVLGWKSVPYPEALRFRLNRVEATGLLAAWNGALLVGVGGAVFAGLLVLWWLLATLYGLLLWAFGGPVGRDLTFAESWRLAGASLLPPAILMTAAIGLYATRQLGLVGLLLAVPIHVVFGWLYCLGSLGSVPRLEASPDNPFEPGDAPPGAGASGARSNPFQSDS